MKRLLAVGALVALVLVGAPSLAAPLSGTFVDDDGNPHEPNIQAIAAEAITVGCGGDRYCPAGLVRRDEMASFLARALDLTPLSSGPFTDIAGNPHAGSINAIADAGITLGCAPGRYCPAAAVRRDEMASFLARAFRLPPAPSPFSDTSGNPHAANIGAIAAERITLGCAVGRYCPADPVRRDEMASFLARALALDPHYVILSLWRGMPLACTKDGLSCTGTFAAPYRPVYEISEGFYHVQPSTASEQGELQAAGTRFELLVDGARQPLTDSTAETGGGTLERRFEGRATLGPGTHTLIGRWWWDGTLVQTTTLTVTVSS